MLVLLPPTYDALEDPDAEGEFVFCVDEAEACAFGPIAAAGVALTGVVVVPGPPAQA
ncbi:MAG: hypothetical protein ACOY0T_28510 [Myxococcota bacterium]